MATKTGKKTEVKKLTLRDKKKAQPGAAKYFSDEEKDAITDTVAKNLSQGQLNIFFYQCQALGLNPLVNEICAVPYRDRKTGKTTLSIQVMRDGFLTIAHRSGKFAGLKSGVKMSKDGKNIIFGWAKVYHRDFKVPLYQEADFEEYNAPIKGGKPTLWATKPKTMIKKVAESMALRKAFNVSGVYASEEMELEIVKAQVNEKPLELEGGNKPAVKTQIATIKALDKKFKVPKDFTKQQAADLIGKLTQKKGKKE